MDSRPEYKQQEELPASAEHNFSNGHAGAFNSLYPAIPDASFGAHWDFAAFQNPGSQAGVYQHSQPSWQQNSLHPSSHPHTNDFGIAPQNFGLSYPQNPASIEYPTFDPRNGLPYSTATYDPSMEYENDHLANSGNFGLPGHAGFSAQHETISPQALQTYPTSYGTSPGVTTAYQVNILFPELLHGAKYAEHHLSLNIRKTMAI